MAETPSTPFPGRAQPQPESGLDSPQYWCYHCDRRVAVETLPDLPDVVCCDCKNGFVESISAAALPSPDAAADPLADPALGSQFIQVLRLIAQAAREEDAPPPLPSDPSDDDYLRIEMDGWDNENDDDDEEDERSVEVVHEEEDAAADTGSDGEEGNGIDVVEPPAVGDDGEDDDEDEDEDEDEEEMRRTRRDILRLSLRDIASRAATRRDMILDWADILMGLEDHALELRLQVSDSNIYVGNPGDYVNAAEYEALLQNLADSDSGAKRGAPPAAKAAVEGLKSVVVEKEEEVMVCAICKDTVNVGEIAKNLPCGHGYHGECIVPWLGSRNTCPVCRFELPTDDPDYEEERKQRVVVAGLRAASSGSSSGGGHDSGLE
ncbi:RING/U-box superfamily protein [Striga asiatica]|uniref:RING-type E3 ubiquitin transferase n=1 Tax=Striga asiatica TaxID=4170 RepID=A0A5A7QQU9_STRAF|nr:RING/U-box superfamily protein [Striga asiatica]